MIVLSKREVDVMFTKLIKKSGFSKEETSWILYDVGNSAQTLTTMTVLFPLLIAYISPGDSSVYVGWANTFYAVFLALLSPILGTIADYKDKKMKFFKFFLTIGIIGGFALALPFLNWQACIIVYIIAMIGYTGTTIFYDAFLVDVTTDERTHKVSSAGYAWGYIGSVLPFIIFIIPFAAVTLFGDADGNLMIGSLMLSYRMAITISMSLAVVWWMYYSRPFIRDIKQRNYHEPVDNVIKESFSRLAITFKNMRKNKNIFLFCLAYFFYIDSVNTVIKMAISLATDMGISAPMSLAVVIFINLIAFPGAILYGKLTQKFGGKIMIYAGIVGYMIIVLAGSQISKNANMIWLVGLLVGMFQGGIQAVSRSSFAMLIPTKEDSNEYFGFFEIFSKFSSIIGPLVISIIVSITGQAEYGILGLIPCMIIGAILLSFVKFNDKKTA